MAEEVLLKARMRSEPRASGEKESRMWRVTVNDTCVGSGMCAAIAAGYFRLGEDEQSHPVYPEVAPNDAVRDAAASCPMEAIVVTDTSTGEAVNP